MIIYWYRKFKLQLLLSIIFPLFFLLVVANSSLFSFSYFRELILILFLFFFILVSFTLRGSVCCVGNVCVCECVVCEQESESHRWVAVEWSFLIFQFYILFFFSVCLFKRYFGIYSKRRVIYFDENVIHFRVEQNDSLFSKAKQ